MVERLFLTVPRGCLQFVIVVFPDHTHLLFWKLQQTQEKLRHSLVQKIARFFVLYLMKLDLVFENYEQFSLPVVQEIREPNHADHVIGHLGNTIDYGLCQCKS